ncbi:DUF2264 domain-containing protein [Kineococcus sp. TRM81007]|uniref:DUF2264 domain-containing protein n=1 Tax=Kineococcus sp. TRM81007 TaxID=2925831 RepID=UPI001F596AF3|nr:DUF2264 domain-containing protein [Kineococcus sp. TRM81007]MCI2240683.1 DUF2264 domain-containing protein [Kineococcus sp. TRM81007]
MTSLSAPVRGREHPAPAADRRHWLATADDLLLATRPHASPGGALLRLPGPVSASGAWSDGLEGYARTFLLAAFRVRGEDGDDPHGHLERYAAGLRSGTDPAGPERWPRIGERRQAVVEAASVAVALSETRPWLWDRLDDGTRERTVEWLAGIVGTSGYRNNWLWFQNVVEAFLAEVGGPWRQEDLDRNDELREALYVGDGWYSDGRDHRGRLRTFDNYTGWAWHLYPLLRARIRGRALEPLHAGRLREYLDQAQHLVGATGAPVLHGRSATYRFAVLAPFWAGAIAGATPLEAGQTRALASAVLEHFTSCGALDERGLLSVGWHRPFPRLRQLYTGAGSPYWASKGFLGLLLGAQHPVWCAEPATPPAWRRERVTLLPVPGWLVLSTPGDGTVRVLNHGSQRSLEPVLAARADDPFYDRQGYSNRTSPQLSPGAIAAPTDSHVALLDERGAPSHRGDTEPLHLAGGVAVSRSHVHWLDLPAAGGDGGEGDGGGAAVWAGLRRGPRLTTASVARGRSEVRLAWWDEPPGAPGASPDVPPELAGVDEEALWPRCTGPFAVHVGGWPLAAGSAADLVVEEGEDWVRVRRGDGTTSLVRAVTGPVLTGAGRRTGADPFGVVSATPWLRSGGHVAQHRVVAALVVLSAAGEDGDLDAVAAVEAEGSGPVRVRWRDGHVDVVPRGREAAR